MRHPSRLPRSGGWGYAIPLYELPESQKLLEAQAPEYSIVQRLTWREYLRICRVCKLYDYRRRRWLNFDGQEN